MGMIEKYNLKRDKKIMDKKNLCYDLIIGDENFRNMLSDEAKAYADHKIYEKEIYENRMYKNE